MSQYLVMRMGKLVCNDTTGSCASIHQLHSYILYFHVFLFRGQGAPSGNSPPYFGPSLKLDFELEMVSHYAIILLFNAIELNQLVYLVILIIHCCVT